jgi:hypothetical protein
MHTLKVLQQAVAAACDPICWQHSPASDKSLERFEKFAGLAGAADIPAESITELITQCIVGQKYDYATVLMHMALARQFDCNQLCKVLCMARTGGWQPDALAALHSSVADAIERCGYFFKHSQANLGLVHTQLNSFVRVAAPAQHNNEITCGTADPLHCSSTWARQCQQAALSCQGIPLAQ